MQMGSSGGNKVMGPQVSPPNLAFQPSDPMDFILYQTHPSTCFFENSESNADGPKQNCTVIFFL